MAIPPWTIELIRRGLTDVARKAGEPETLEKIKSQAAEILQDLPTTAARGLDAVMRSAETGKKSVQRWTRKHTTLAIPMLNATGTLLTEHGCGVRSVASAIEISSELSEGDTRDDSEIRSRIARRAARVIPGGENHRVAIAASIESAIAAISVLGSTHDLTLHRSSAIRLASGVMLPDLLRSFSDAIGLAEVGQPHIVSESDFGYQASTLAILADDGQTPVQTVALESDQARQVVILPIATMLDAAIAGIPSAQAMLDSGADLVILPGGGLAGGPPCGVLVGRKELVDEVVQSPMWSVMSAPLATQAAMVATMETEHTSNSELPIQVLLRTAEENLNSRADRLAIRLRGQDSIADCQVSHNPARITVTGRWQLPSRQIRIRHQSRSAETWANELAQEFPSVLARVDGQELVVDLRWIAASSDGKLAQLLGVETDATTGASRDHHPTQQHPTQGDQTQGDAAAFVQTD